MFSPLKTVNSHIIFCISEMSIDAGVELVKYFYQTDSATIALRKLMTTENLSKPPCSTQAVTDLINKFEKFGTVQNLR